MKKNVFFVMFTCTLLLTVSCSEKGSEPLNPEDPETSLRIKNATGQNFRELLPSAVVSEPGYGGFVQDFYYTVNVGHFGFNLDTLANGSLSAYRNSFSETSATQLFTRCRFTCRINNSNLSYYTKSIDVKDTIDLPEQITCKLGKRYTLVLNDLKGDVDFIENK
jgi:hypothetical protein